MFDIIRQILNHTYQGSYNSDEQYVYAIAGAVIVLISIVFIDRILSLFRRYR